MLFVFLCRTLVKHHTGCAAEHGTHLDWVKSMDFQGRWHLGGSHFVHRWLKTLLWAKKCFDLFRKKWKVYGSTLFLICIFSLNIHEGSWCFDLIWADLLWMGLSYSPQFYRLTLVQTSVLLQLVVILPFIKLCKWVFHFIYKNQKRAFQCYFFSPCNEQFFCCLGTFLHCHHPCIKLLGGPDYPRGWKMNEKPWRCCFSPGLPGRNCT